MSLVTESALQLPTRIRENQTVGAGLSSWVVRLDAVAKYYTSSEDKAREMAVFKRLSSGTWHKRILQFYGVLDGCAILQFACHGSIRQYLASRQRHEFPPLSIRLRWAEQIVDAISFLHSQGIFHCDISCNNIFLDGDFNVAIGDFGGSSIDNGPSQGWYEVSHSHPDITTPSEKSEIFALGSTFFEMLTGKKPFEGENDAQIEQFFRQGHFPGVQALPVLQNVILSCWMRRYEHTSDLLADIKRCQSGQPLFETFSLSASATLIAVLSVTWWIVSSRRRL